MNILWPKQCNGNSVIISKFKRFKIIWKIPRFLPAEDCGPKLEKGGVSLAKQPPKGYGTLSAVRLEFNGPDHKMREREREKSRGARPPEKKKEAAGLHGRPARARRRRP